MYGSSTAIVQPEVWVCWFGTVTSSTQIAEVGAQATDMQTRAKNQTWSFGRHHMSPIGGSADATPVLKCCDIGQNRVELRKSGDPYTHTIDSRKNWRVTKRKLQNYYGGTIEYGENGPLMVTIQDFLTLVQAINLKRKLNNDRSDTEIEQYYYNAERMLTQ